MNTDYNYTNVYKNWLTNNLEMDSDIHRIIKTHLMSREFQIPELYEFDNATLIYNNENVAFKKMNLLNSQHNHQNKEALLTINNGKIIRIRFFYIDDLTHYYEIDFNKSHIQNITIVKQPYHLYKGRNNVHVSVIDPIFIVK